MGKLLVTKTEHFAVRHAEFCIIPRDLIMEPLTAVPNLWTLPEPAQAELGRLQARCARAIQETVSPLRIYYLVFAEENPTYHCHIFPRSVEATAQYRNAFPERGENIQGPAFFDWARCYYSGDASQDSGILGVMERLSRLIIAGAR